MLTPARLLRLLRLAADLSVDDAAISSDLPILRVRALEAGAAELSYLEGLVLAKAYQLCPNCFAKHFRAAALRDALDTPPSQVPETPEPVDG
jgi:hypothetical protein